MSIKALIEFASNFLEVDPALEALLEQVAQPRSFAKGEHLFNAGSPCDHLFVMIKGLVRCYYLHEDKEVNLRLLAEPSVVLAYSSYIQRTVSREYIQALEPCEGFWFSRAQMDAAIDAFPPLQRLTTNVAERHFLAMENRLLMIQYKSAEERLRFFLEHTDPAIIERTPAVHIASYLGMTPESLSRTKRQITKSDR
ncbi:Crp/Fnr family transcriptional regulator [Spongiibacter sp. KMU-158]|uniref:Crp/Fnr family transcriptional regulator n=1 Tax=Spongiibacter pelagi TaxID=2760804 RepID=A0A927C3P1_9GAMM|nr:Crp/Fnr family transcriptional regulator [Spongiibacter pelagi]MBD2858895.1 Crp/Fnr family transcriptional regulator [Spongiibacter pelagi]